MNRKRIGLYIHIPFCVQKCKYCDFISFVDREEAIAKYIVTLKEEIKKENLENYEIKTIYIGGGTPSSISSKYIVEILDLINKRQAEEITIEVNPGTVTMEKLKDYKRAGINRLSIGLQTADDRLLNKIGRIHNFKDFENTFAMAKEIGFTNINIDLMIGLPTQTLQDVDRTLNKIIKLNVNHISVYSLIVEEKTPLAKEIEIGKLKLPDEITERHMYWQVKRKLEEEGFKHYEISNFAKPGFESKHNLDCWGQEEYIGLGLAAHSYLNRIRYSNTNNLEEYLKDNEYKKIIYEQQTIEEQEKEYMLLGLRKIEGVNIQKFKNKFTKNPIYIYRVELDRLFRNKLIEIDANYIKLTEKGIDLANLVWEEFV